MSPMSFLKPVGGAGDGAVDPGQKKKLLLLGAAALVLIVLLVGYFLVMPSLLGHTQVLAGRVPPKTSSAAPSAVPSPSPASSGAASPGAKGRDPFTALIADTTSTGSSGSSGTSGTSGTTGSSGTNGTSGTTGPSGSTGSPSGSTGGSTGSTGGSTGSTGSTSSNYATVQVLEVGYTTTGELDARIQVRDMNGSTVTTAVQKDGKYTVGTYHFTVTKISRPSISQSPKDEVVTFSDSTSTFTVYQGQTVVRK